MIEKKRHIDEDRSGLVLWQINVLNWHLREALKAFQEEQTRIEVELRSLTYDFDQLVKETEPSQGDDVTRWDQCCENRDMLHDTYVNIFGVRVPTIENNHDRSDV